MKFRNNVFKHAQKAAFLAIVLLCTMKGQGQNVLLLDSLFQKDFSGISSDRLHLQEAEIEKLSKDWGLSVGVNITNSIQEEIDAGLSTRIFVRSNLLHNGWYGNGKEAEIIRNQILIDSLMGVDGAISHTYGILYDHALYSFNKLKIDALKDIIDEAEKVKEYYFQLYFNKLIDYEEILEVASLIDQFSLLRQSQLLYNESWSDIAWEINLSSLDIEEEWTVDFEGIICSIDDDSLMQQSVEFKNEVLDLQYEKNNSPSLSLSAGYDISRHRPFYGLRFNSPISFGKKEVKKAKKLQNQNEVRRDRIQRKKEVLNLQYEYFYAEKQLEGFKTKRSIIQEKKRLSEVKREILALGEDKVEKRLRLEELLIGYEVLEIRQKQLLILLGIKKVLKQLPIDPYIKRKREIEPPRRFAGKRYLPIEDINSLSSTDQHFLSQNELNIIHPDDVQTLENYVAIFADNYANRSELESAILLAIEKDMNTNIVFFGLEQLKTLELKTLNQRVYGLASTSIINLPDQ